MDGRQIKAIAMANNQRFQDTPNLKTLSEQGFGTTTFSSWIGLIAPPGTPEPIVKKLNSAVGSVMQEDNVRNLLVEQGFMPAESTPEAFRNIIRSDAQRYKSLITKAGITVN